MSRGSIDWLFGKSHLQKRELRNSQVLIQFTLKRVVCFLVQSQQLLHVTSIREQGLMDKSIYIRFNLQNVRDRSERINVYFVVQYWFAFRSV